MKDIYALSGKAKIAGVIGWPVEHSRSPRLHGYWLKKHGIDGAYVPLPVKPENIKQAIRALAALGFKGANVTIPHKENILSYIDHVDLHAKRVGAVNTIIVKEDGFLEGINTDVFGFTENIRPFLQTVDKGRFNSATILGAGGAARAIIVALQEAGCAEIRLVNRTRERAEHLAKEFISGGNIRVFDWSKTKEALKGTALLINTSALGMVGQPPLEIDISPLPEDAWVTDIVYAPLITELLKKAQARKLRVIDGLGMLLHQARPGFAAWFGIEPEVTDELRRHVIGDA